MRYFPIFLDLEDQAVLIVGGGETALQKLRLLAKTNAHICVVAPLFDPEIAAIAKKNSRVELIEREYSSQDMDNKRLAYAASDDETLDRLVAQNARSAGVLLNKVDDPSHCDFITPSIVDRDPICVAIGTEGTAPLLAREIKAQVDKLLPANFGALGAMAARIRPLILERLVDGRDRLRLWERLLAGPFRRAVLNGDEAHAQDVFETELELSQTASVELSHKQGVKQDQKEIATTKGHVALIGAGPGDPDLLTLKAMHRLQGADVLVIDRLVSASILDYARRDAKRIYVGKQAGGPSVSQDQINQILVREALTGARVVRVKGGDPNVFGRCQEELAACQLMGIEVEVVPGISAAQAASASIQLPLTFRGTHRSITLLTAATKDQVISSDVMAFMKAGRPFAIYMGVKLADEIVNVLSSSGVDMSEQILIVENASLREERVFSTALSELSVCVKTFSIDGPAILFVGLSYDEMGLQADPRLKAHELSNVVSLSRQVV